MYRADAACVGRAPPPYRVPWWPLRVSSCGPHMYPPPPQRRALRVYTPKDSPPAVHPSTLAHGCERGPEAAVRHGAVGAVYLSLWPQRIPGPALGTVVSCSRSRSRPCARHGVRSACGFYTASSYSCSLHGFFVRLLRAASSCGFYIASSFLVLMLALVSVHASKRSAPAFWTPRI